MVTPFGTRVSRTSVSTELGACEGAPHCLSANQGFSLYAFPAVVDRIARGYGLPAVTVVIQDDLDDVRVGPSSQAIELIVEELIANAWTPY